MATMVPFAYERIAEGEPLAGVLVLPWKTPIGRGIDFLATLIEAGSDEDFRNAVFQFP